MMYCNLTRFIKELAEDSADTDTLKMRVKPRLVKSSGKTSANSPKIIIRRKG